MPINGFSVGRDVALDIITPQGPRRFSLVTKFTSKPTITDKKIKGLDGITKHARFWDGWEGSFEIERQDSTVDAYFAALEDSYYQGISEQPCTITETVSEPDGSVTQWRYVNVLLKLDDAGDWKGDDTVKQKVSFIAARRQQI